MDYELDTPSTSSLISSRYLSLNSQQFNNFNFTPTANFGPGGYPLIEAGSDASGILGISTSGTIDGLPATLAVSGNEVVLTVVPEPSTLALLAAGAAGLLGYGLRRRRVARMRSQQLSTNKTPGHSVLPFAFVLGERGTSGRLIEYCIERSRTWVLMHCAPGRGVLASEFHLPSLAGRGAGGAGFAAD